MTDLQIGDLSAAALLLGAGLLLGLVLQGRVEWRWLFAGVVLVVLNNLLLSSFYGLVPDFIGGERNWLGKGLAIAGTLVIASQTAFGWRRVGLRLDQNAGSLTAAIPVALLYCGFFLAIAMAFPADESTLENTVFQLTMPGLEEEPFYRGILLVAFDRAFSQRLRFLGVDWGWGAVFSSLAFGLAHAFGFSDGTFSFDPVTMALTAIPSLIAVWLVYRTGSLLLPIALHNFGNAVGLFVK